MVEPLFGADNVLDITGERQPEAVAAPTQPRKSVVKAKPEPEPEPEEEEAPAPVADDKPKRGFGSAKTEEPQAAKPKAAAKPEPKAAVEVDDDVANLADEIASLIGDDDY